MAIDLDILRDVKVEALTGRVWRLTTWDTGRQDRRGQAYIGYRLVSPDGPVIFEGEDFAGSPMNADDSDDTLRALLGFLTLKPGDTDSEYFADYTPEQRAFSESYECEAMAVYGLDDETEPFEDWGGE